MTLKRLLTVGGVCAGCVASLGPGAPATDDFAPHTTYLFFVDGASAGTSDITLTAEGGKYVFTSTSRIQVGEEAHSLSCRTEFEKTTLRPLRFRYEGERNAVTLSGNVELGPDSVRAVLEVGGTKMPSRSPWTDGTVVFQNYVPEHLAVLARRLAVSDKPYERFVFLFPSEMMTTPALAIVESEIELATRPKPTVCRKFAVSVQNSAPFDLYVDSERNSRVYMDFRIAKTEVFLHSAFGDQPHTRYGTPPEPAADD